MDDGSGSGSGSDSGACDTSSIETSIGALDTKVSALSGVPASLTQLSTDLAAVQTSVDAIECSGGEESTGGYFKELNPGATEDYSLLVKDEGTEGPAMVMWNIPATKTDMAFIIRMTEYDYEGVPPVFGVVPGSYNPGDNMGE